MGFMERQIEHGDWFEADTLSDGIVVIPADLVGIPAFVVKGETYTDDTNGWASILGCLREFLPSDGVNSVRLISGWGARLSAPGYLDCTEWSVFETEQEAADYLTETYGDDDDDSID